MNNSSNKVLDKQQLISILQERGGASLEQKKLKMCVSLCGMCVYALTCFGDKYITI